MSTAALVSLGVVWRRLVLMYNGNMGFLYRAFRNLSGRRTQGLILVLILTLSLKLSHPNSNSNILKP